MAKDQDEIPVCFVVFLVFCLFGCFTFAILVYYGILCSRKKKLLPFTAAWMELESTMLSEISQVAKDKYHDLTYNKEPNEQNRTRGMETRNKLTMTRGEE